MNDEGPEAVRCDFSWGALTLYLISIGLIALCLWIVRPFVPGMTWAVVLGIVTQPVYRWMLARLRRPGLAATVTLIVVSLSIVVPSLTLILSAGNHILILLKSVQRESAAEALRQFVGNHSSLRDALQFVMNNMDLDAAMQKAAGAAAGQVGAVLGGTIHAITQIIVMLFLLFFLYRDKDAALGLARRMIPLKADETQFLLGRVENAVRALVLGRFAVAAVQGLLAGTAYALLGVGAATLLGALTMLLAMVPAVGAFVVWVPVVVYLFAIHHWVQALILLGAGALVISTLDNVLYPILVGTRLQLHTGPIFLAMLGGVVLFGVSGLILGPIAFSVTETMLDIWRERSGKAAESLATD
ncbi:MAG: AI-2E family transporter [Terracidiphilus sp.]